MSRMAGRSGAAIRSVSALRESIARRSSAEELGRRFKVDEGIGIVELSFHSGHFEHAWLKRRVQKAQLADAE